MYYYSKAIYDNNTFAPLAKLDIASVYGTEGQGFESLTACHKKRIPNRYPFLCYVASMFRGPLVRPSSDGQAKMDEGSVAKRRSIPIIILLVSWLVFLFARDSN